MDRYRNSAKSNKRTVIAAICVTAAVALTLAGLFLLRNWEEGYSRVSPGATGKPEDSLTYYDGAWYQPRKDLETVLLIGIDKAALDETMDVQGEYEQSDFLMLLVIDKMAKSSVVLHINRDTMTEIQMLSDSGRVEGRVTVPITLAHSYGGQPEIRCRNTVAAVSNLLYGVNIDHYISLAMDGVRVLNDMVGGVTLESMDDFAGLGLSKGETVTLLGDQALTYVRARKGMEDDSNIHRMERQRQYLEALQDQMLSQMGADQDFTLSALMELNDYMVSNCSVEQLSSLADTLAECGETQYRSLEGEAELVGRFMEFYVDEDALRQTVMELFYEKVRED